MSAPNKSTRKIPQNLSLNKSGPQISFRVPASKQTTIKTKGRSRIGAVEVSSALVPLIGVVSDDPRQFHFRGSSLQWCRALNICAGVALMESRRHAVDPSTPYFAGFSKLAAEWAPLRLVCLTQRTAWWHQRERRPHRNQSLPQFWSGEREVGEYKGYLRTENGGALVLQMYDVDPASYGIRWAWWCLCSGAAGRRRPTTIVTKFEHRSKNYILWTGQPPRAPFYFPD